MPRHFIRHPAEIPLQLQQTCNGSDLNNISHDLSAGGLSCDSACYLEPGSEIELTIQITPPGIQVKGRVIWCHRQGKKYSLGVGFECNDSAFTMRMLEQACQIECYRRRQRSFGRLITSEQAAQEWISNHAAKFPTLVA